MIGFPGSKWLSKPPMGFGIDSTNPLARGLVAGWLFNESAGTTNDLRSRNPGTLQTGATWASGRIGPYVSMDGNTGYVNVPSSTTFDFPTALSISAWVNPSVAGTYPPIVVRSSARAEDSADFALYLFNAGQLLSYSSSSAPDSIQHRFHSAGLLVPLNAWSYVGVSVAPTGGALVLYLATPTSFASESFTSPLRISTSTNALTIGSWVAGGASPWQGGISSPLIWNRALSTAEHQSLAANPYQMIQAPAARRYFAVAAAGPVGNGLLMRRRRFLLGAA